LYQELVLPENVQFFFLFKNGYHIFTMQAPPIHKPEDQLQLEMPNGWY